MNSADNMDKKSLKALLLVGGFGTRFRPLTLSKPKPLVEFINIPILSHQIEALKKVGVDEIVLAINYQPEKMYDYIKWAEENYSIKITCSKENEPLGTAGPIGLAREILKETDGEIFVFNSDITCRFPLQDMLDFHRSHGCEGTIAVTRVKDPSKFGVILSDTNKKILNFIEKPQEWIGDNINAGLYIFNKKFLDRVKPVPTSIEREIFPQMAKEGELYVFSLEGFWADIGQPKDYLKGTNLYLDDLSKRYSNKNNENTKDLEGLPELAKGPNIIGSVIIDPSAIIAEDCCVGPNVVVGPYVVIKSGARIKNSVILEKVIVNNHAYIDNSIIGWKSQVGKWSRIENLSFLGEEVNVAAEISLNSAVILPNVPVKANVKDSIIMF